MTRLFTVANVAVSFKYARRHRRGNRHHGHRCDWTRRYLSQLAGLYLQNEDLFFVRRCLQRLLAGELTARDAIERMRRHPSVLDEDPFPGDWPDSQTDRTHTPRLSKRY